MVAASFLFAVAALVGMLSPLAPAVAEPLSGKPLVIELGAWTFSLPEGWTVEKGESGPYFESPDGNKGCYVKLIPPQRGSRTAPELAAEIQRIYLKTFQGFEGRKWRVMTDESRSTEEATYSTLDIYDDNHGYRILSKVIARRDGAVQLTLHDYVCKDYAESVRFFAPIAESLGPRSQ